MRIVDNHFSVFFGCKSEEKWVTYCAASRGCAEHASERTDKCASHSAGRNFIKSRDIVSPALTWEGEMPCRGFTQTSLKISTAIFVTVVSRNKDFLFLFSFNSTFSTQSFKAAIVANCSKSTSVNVASLIFNGVLIALTFIFNTLFQSTDRNRHCVSESSFDTLLTNRYMTLRFVAAERTTLSSFDSKNAR